LFLYDSHKHVPVEQSSNESPDEEAAVLNEMKASLVKVEQQQQLLLEAQQTREALKSDKRRVFSRVVLLKSDNKVKSQTKVRRYQTDRCAALPN
jgi:hypothetical protein